MKGKIFSYGSVGWGIILLIVLPVFIFYSNCTKKSTQYEPRRGYCLYTHDTGGSDPTKWIYVISTETDSVVDSIYMDPYKWPGYLALSPDKRTLYVLVNIFDTTSHTFTSTYYEIDTRTKARKYIGPNSSIVISPDGRYLFQWEGEFRIFDACTHQLIYSESTQFLPGCFDKKAPLAYGGSEKLGEMRVFNYISKRWVRSFTIHLRDGRIPLIRNYVLSSDCNILYILVTASPYEYYFCVFDLTQDSLLVQLGINSVGQLAIKPDGSTVYTTDPGGGGGCIVIEPPPTGKLGVFDTKTNTPLPSISLDVLGDSIHLPPLNPFFIKITPDGQKAYLSICHDRILVIDLVRNEPLKAIIFPDYINAAVSYMAL